MYRPAADYEYWLPELGETAEDARPVRGLRRDLDLDEVAAHVHERENEGEWTGSLQVAVRLVGSADFRLYRSTAHQAVHYRAHSEG